MKTFLLSLALLVLSSPSQEIFREKISRFADSGSTSMASLTLEIAKSFIGTPYKAGLLEKTPEMLSVHLDSTDCIIFVESCIALAQTLRSGDRSYADFCSNLQNMRYRDGWIDGYGSRLHYTSEWILQAGQRGVLREYTADYGHPLQQEFYFMSSHPELYPQLSDGETLSAILQTERRLNASGPYYSTVSIPAGIREGDIIAFVSRTPGLDISHVGIACKGEDGRMHFIHASSAQGKVVLDARTLSRYAAGKEIRLLRLED